MLWELEAGWLVCTLKAEDGGQPERTSVFQAQQGPIAQKVTSVLKFKQEVSAGPGMDDLLRSQKSIKPRVKQNEEQGWEGTEEPIQFAHGPLLLVVSQTFGSELRFWTYLCVAW